MVVQHTMKSDGVMKHAQGRVIDVGITLTREGREWKLPVLLFADDTAPLSDDERGLGK